MKRRIENGMIIFLYLPFNINKEVSVINVSHLLGKLLTVTANASAKVRLVKHSLSWNNKFFFLSCNKMSPSLNNFTDRF